MNNMNEMARLHSAGATVRHTSPFGDLPSHKNGRELSAEFLKEWAIPYYMKIGAYNETDWVRAIKNVKTDISKDICLLLLGDFNWRTRLVGAYFSAVKGYTELIDIIGTHLLKSEICCVGHIYALVLAFFNTTTSVGYLNKYLDYYLTQPALYFDQEQVLCALIFLDQQNGTQYAAKHMDGWKALKAERSLREKNMAAGIVAMFGKQEGGNSQGEFLRLLAEAEKDVRDDLNASYFAEGVKILAVLNN